MPVLSPTPGHGTQVTVPLRVAPVGTDLTDSGAALTGPGYLGGYRSVLPDASYSIRFLVAPALAGGTPATLDVHPAVGKDNPNAFLGATTEHPVCSVPGRAAFQCDVSVDGSDEPASGTAAGSGTVVRIAAS